MSPLQPATLAAHTPSRDLMRDTTIRRIETRILDVPTIRKHRLSSTSVNCQSYVHVAVQFENGVVGHGEASTLGGPRWAEESVEAIKANIDSYLAPVLIGKPGCQLEAAALLLGKAAKRNFAAKSALDAALLDALGITLDVSAATLLGGAVREKFSVIWALASGDPVQETEEALSKLEAGKFNRFKIKLGFADPSQDISRLAQLRKNLPEQTQIIADVNQAWSEAETIRWLPVLKDLQIDLVEQPLPAEQTAAMARTAARSPIPLMLDEAVFTEEEALAACSEGAGSVLSLKLCKHGSAHALKRVAGIADAAGLQLYGGCLLESSLGAAAHLAVFATLPSLQWGTEHFGPLILESDTTLESLHFEDFHVHLPSGPGLGVQVNPIVAARFDRET